MPYGFIRHIEQKGYSVETVKSYEKVIGQFFAFIKGIYHDDKEPFQISPADIRLYLKTQEERQKSISTINKELAILKTMFHYFWEIDKVPIDPTVKIKRMKIRDKVKLEITYPEIRELLVKTLNNPNYSPLRKAIFLLATKGLKTAEFRFPKDAVKIFSMENKVEIQLKKRKIVLEGIEATIFKVYYHESLQNATEFVFITNHRNGEHAGPIEVMSILSHLRVISLDYLPKDTPALTLISIRKALAYELYKNRHSIQAIANILGIEENSASNYLKSITEGMLLQKTNTL